MSKYWRWVPGVVPMALGGTILFAGVAAALGNAWFGYPSGEKFYALLHPICHQFGTLSFWLEGHPMGICARCTGGYSGLLLGAMVFYLLCAKVSPPVLLLVGIFSAVAGIGEAYLHLSDDNVWRFTSGLIGGTGLALTFCSLVVIIAGIVVGATQKAASFFHKVRETT